MAHDRYISPFSTRYASDEMQYTFSDDNKFRTWRRLWIALAKAEQKQGLDITDEQIAELEAHKDDINYEEAVAREKLVRHDVMSHVYAYGLQCPKAKGIIHLGATSCYVGDNTDVIIMREGLQLVRKKLIGVLANLAVEGGIDATTIGKDVAMQIAALNPRFWDKSLVTEDVIAEEKKVLVAQMDNDPKMATKPQQVKEKIAAGKLNKFYEENCLLQQEFVKDNSMSVEQYMAAAAKELGGKVKFVDAVRFEKGEGLEKRNDDFASEVANMVK